MALLAAAFALTACQPGAGPLAAKDGPGATAGTVAVDNAAPVAKTQKSTRLVDRDVEAPNVFQVTDQALWDGRPSLGGVWVASPDTKDPERVIMRNPANGKFVIGALFRRERENPGPALQISSDAAAALGMLAGAPANISVTALRREEAPEVAPATPILDTAETLDGTASAAAGAIDAGGVKTTSLDAPAQAAKGAKKPGKTGMTAAETAATAAGALAAAPKTPAAKAPVAKTPAAKAPAPAASATQPSGKASGGRAIQIGIFSVEANAKRAVSTLASAGITAEIRPETTKGKAFWSVIARGDAATLKKVKSAGFADAYLLK